MAQTGSLLCIGCWQQLHLPVPLRGVLSWPFRAVGLKPSRMNPNTCTLCELAFTTIMRKRNVDIDATVMFADLRGYTSLTESLPTDSMPELLVNRADSVTEAKQILERFRQTVETFLHCSAPAGCWIAEDSCVAQAVDARRPFVETVPESSASRDVRAIAKRLLAGAKPIRTQTLLERL